MTGPKDTRQREMLKDIQKMEEKGSVLARSGENSGDGAWLFVIKDGKTCRKKVARGK